MTGGTILFWFLAATTAFGAVAVVVSQNVVRMAFWLIVSLGSTAGLYFLLHADFVAATQLLVYVGGTVVLLIFGVMLTASGPYNLLKTSPGSLIGVTAAAAIVFFLMYQSITGVNWDRSILRQVAIAPERFEEIRNAAGEEEAGLLKSAFSPQQVHEAQVYRYAPEEELSSDAEQLLLSLLKDNGLSFAPATETGGTIRPIGFSLLGSRPDRDLGTPTGLERLSDGFYAVKTAPARDGQPAAEGEEAETKVAISTGYLLPFEIASVHLLVVLISAAYLARAKRRLETRTP